MIGKGIFSRKMKWLTEDRTPFFLVHLLKFTYLMNNEKNDIK